MQEIITKSLRDTLSKDVLFFVLKIAFGALAITLIVSWFLWDSLSAFIASYLSWIPWAWLQTSGSTLAALALGYMFFIISITLLTSLYSESLLVQLAQKHYPKVPRIGEAGITTSFFITLKSSMIFLILFMIFIWALFIPVLGQIAMLYLWSVLIKETTVYDVGSLFIRDKNLLKEKNKKARMIAMIASLFNYIPLLNIFSPIFAQILFLHHLLYDKQR
ncbi:MAG: EI24 domain-containing protein [Campylobacterales bacterium]|nr:EI24 domain-containing protein [Campylobacterales bacterium]